MTLADKLTFSRIIFAPVFFIIYLLPGKAVWTVPVLIIIFVVSEVTDLLDGMIARKLNEVSDFGKLLDPFADTLMQVTCFLCFMLDGIFPAFLFLIVTYREFGILFIRNLMLKKGITLGARLGGKIKTISFVVAASVALLAVSVERLTMGIQILATFGFLVPYLKIASLVFFIISVAISVGSFIDYLVLYLKTAKSLEKKQ